MNKPSVHSIMLLVQARRLILDAQEDLEEDLSDDEAEALEGDEPVSNLYAAQECIEDALRHMVDTEVSELHAENYPNGCGITWLSMCEECCQRLGYSQK